MKQKRRKVGFMGLVDDGNQDSGPVHFSAEIDAAVGECDKGHPVVDGEDCVRGIVEAGEEALRRASRGSRTSVGFHTVSQGTWDKIFGKKKPPGKG